MHAFLDDEEPYSLVKQKWEPMQFHSKSVRRKLQRHVEVQVAASCALNCHDSCGLLANASSSMHSFFWLPGFLQSLVKPKPCKARSNAKSDTDGGFLPSGVRGFVRASSCEFALFPSVYLYTWKPEEFVLQAVGVEGKL